MDEVRKKLNQAAKSDSGDNDLADAAYACVRNLGYTWEELLSEKVPRTMFSIDKLIEEHEKREENAPDGKGDLKGQSGSTMNAN